MSRPERIKNRLDMQIRLKWWREREGGISIKVFTEGIMLEPLHLAAAPCKSAYERLNREPWALRIQS